MNKKEAVFSYFVQPNEMAGFVFLLDAGDFYAQEKEKNEKNRWLTLFPELKKTKFEELIDFFQKEKETAKSTKHISLMDAFKKLIPHIQSLEDLKKIIAKSPNSNFNPEKINAIIQPVFEIYHRFYSANEDKLNNFAKLSTNTLNDKTVEFLSKAGRFFNPKYQPKMFTTYVFPSSVSGVRGQSFHTVAKDFITSTEDKQSLAIGSNVLDGTAKMGNGLIFSTIFHETIHGLFEDSGARGVMSKYLPPDNPIVKTLETFPELKRNPNVSDKNEAEMMINEAITCAFQGILEKEKRPDGIRENLYSHPVINIMAHKTIPLLKDAMETGETFGPDFMKKFEKEFISSMDEMQKKIHEQKVADNLKACLSKGKYGGENLKNETSRQQAFLAKNNQLI